jgi:transmembrane 9 superfamily protein 2/4
MRDLIDNQYRVNMVLDNLPVTTQHLGSADLEFVSQGVDVGFKDGDRHYVFNHLVFKVLVHPTHGEYLKARRDSAAALLESVDARRRRSLLAAGAASAEAAAAAATAAKGGSRRLLKDDDGKEEEEEEEDRTKAVPPAPGTEERVQSPPGAVVNKGEDRLPQAGERLWMVVGFEARACSIKRDPSKPPAHVECGEDGDAPAELQEVKEGERIVYTYDVQWEESATRWASRWDAYLRMPGGKVHWFAILNSTLIVLVMASLVAMILVRTVRRDLSRFEALVVDAAEARADARDEAGWKLLTGDAFRAPESARALAAQVGAGAQVAAVTAVTLLLAALGFLSPASRGALLTTTVVLYVLLAALAGAAGVYAWGWANRSYEGWAGVALRVGAFYPGVCGAIFTALEVAIKHTGSTGAIPAGMYFAILALWFLVSLPLTFVGAFLATRLPILDHPVKTNQIPRQVPPPPLVAHPALLFLSAGLLPFGTLFVETFFLITSAWMGFFYYLFSFLGVCLLLTAVINAEISVLCTYVQLCAEDHRWWWRSFRRGGAVALYVALYAVGFLFSSLSSLHGFLPVLLYLSYTAILCLGLYLAMGAIGFVASAVFVHCIMKAAKSD